MGRAAPHRCPALLLLPLVLVGAVAAPAFAQPPVPSQGLVVRDGTLGSGLLDVGPGVDPLGRSATYLITPELGEQRGSNLFHSFRRFGIAPGETATFTGPDPIDGPQSVRNVISRVTGGEPSQIEGTLSSTIEGADVWLFNPQGVGFGAGARIDVPGAFHAGSADSVEFEGGGEPFRARAEPEPLLATAKPSAFGFLPDGERAALVVEGGLRVTRGQALLSGGDVTLTGAGLVAPGAQLGFEATREVRLEAGSTVDVSGAAPGSVSIRSGRVVVAGSSRLLAESTSSRPEGGAIDVAASESVLIDDSLLSVNTRAAGNAGTIRLASPEIAVEGRGLGILEDTENLNSAKNRPHATKWGVSAETEAGGRGGEIEIEAGTLTVRNGASVSARSFENAVTPVLTTGRAGTIRVDADRVTVENRSEIAATAWRTRGDAGEIHFDVAERLLVDGRDGYAWINTGSVYDHLLPGGDKRTYTGGPSVPGAPGWITISGPGGRAGTIELLNSGIVESACRPCTSTLADPGRPENAGTIQIAADTLRIVDWGAPSSNEAAHVAAFTSGDGDAGTVSIQARELDLLESGFLGAVTFAGGAAGTVAVHADNFLIKGRDPGHYLSGIYAAGLGTGGGGMITVERGDSGGAITIGAGGILAVSTDRGTLGGSIDLDVDSLVIDSGGALEAAAYGTASGPGGTITVAAHEITIAGSVGAWTNGTKNAGEITLNADSIAIESGGSVNAWTSGTGDAGAITLNAGSLVIEGNLAAATRRGTGRGGDILVSAGKVRVAAGGQLDASSVFGGDAGAIRITATDSIVLDHPENGAPFSLLGILGYVVSGIPSGDLTGIYSATIGGGLGGSIQLDAPEIAINGGAFIATSSVGGGDAGDILLGRELAKRIRLESGGFVDSTSLPLLFDDVARPGGAAGSVTLEAGEQIDVTGRRAVTLRGAAFEEWSHVSSATLGSGAPGAVTLDAPRIVVDGGAVATTAVAAANGWEGNAGGDIALVSDELVLRNGGRVDASSFIAGPGGRIAVHAGGSIAVDGEGSGLSSRTGGAGTGGDVALSAPVIRVSRGGEVSATSERGLGPVREIFASLDVDGLLAEPAQATGDAGAVSLAASHLVHLDAGDIKTSVESALAGGGDIDIDPLFVILENGSRILATADNGGTGGRIRITTENFLAFPGSEVRADSNIRELSGTVEIHSPDVNLAGALAELPSTFLDAASQMRERCAARRSGERLGSFAVRGAGGIPAEPDGWLPAPLLPHAGASLADADSARPLVVASLAGPRLPSGACP